MTGPRAFFASFRRRRLALPVIIILGCAFAWVHAYTPLVSGYTEFVLVTAAINIILCASLNLVNGYMGEFSVGHAGFMALGAYASSIFSVKLLPESSHQAPVFFLIVAAGGAVAAVVGLLLALLSFKTRGDYLAIVTLAFLMIVKSGFENIDYVGGPRGLSGIPLLTTLPAAMLWVAVALGAMRNLLYSKFGRAVAAIREDELAANATGVRVRRTKVGAFVVSAFFGGVAGALFSHQIQFINPSSFDIVKSTEILAMVYFGGVGSLTGSVLGAVVFTVLGQVLQPLGSWRLVVMPALLVLLMLFRPRGLLGLRELSWFVPGRELFRRRSEPAASAEDPR